MRRATRIVLIAGCALVLALELPGTLAGLAEGLRGPYACPPAATLSVSATLARGGALHGLPPAGSRRVAQR